MKTTMSGNMEYQRDEHRVHLVVYHLIWCPKRRKSILTGTIKDRLIELVQQKCAEKGWDILELAVQPDHVHVFLRVCPPNSPAAAINNIHSLPSFHFPTE